MLVKLSRSRNVAPRQQTARVNCPSCSGTLRRCWSLPVVATALLLAPAAHAQTTWTGLALNNDWFSRDNWSNGVPHGQKATNNTGISITFIGDDSAESFLSDASFVLRSGTLSGTLANSASNFQVNNTFQVIAGNLNNFTIQPGSGGQGITFVDSSTPGFANDIFNANLNLSGSILTTFTGTNTINSTVNLATVNYGIYIQSTGSGASLVPGVTTLSATGNVLGFGAITGNNTGTFTNNGNVNANTAGKTLVVNPGTVNQNSIFQATNGGTLYLSGTIIGGTLGKFNTDSNTNSIIFLGGDGTLTGTVNTNGNGITFTQGGGNVIRDLTNNGILNFSDNTTGSSFATVRGTNTNTGTINFSSSNYGMFFDASSSLTNTGTIQGYGYGIQPVSNSGGGTLTNNGTINANVANKTLTVAPGTLAGNGVFEATNGGVLFLSGMVNGGATSKFNTDNNANSVIYLGGDGTLTGTVGSSTGSGITFTQGGGNVIRDLTNNGILNFSDNTTGSSFATVRGTNTNAGTINFSSSNYGMFFDASSSLTNTGTIQGYGYGIQPVSNSGGGTLTNNGTINANVANKTLTVVPGTLAGNGVFEATNGGTLSLGGLINASAGSHFNTDSNPASALYINGGTLSGTVGSSTGTGITFAQSGGNNVIRDLTNNGILNFSDNATGSSYATVRGTNTNAGTINFAGDTSYGMFFDAGSSLTNTGTIQGYGYGIQPVSNSGGGTLTNNGTINANVANKTLTVVPGTLAGNGVFEATNGGTLSLGGLINASAGSHFNTDSNPASALYINGGTLSGTVGSSTGTGITFAQNGTNIINNANIGGTLTFNDNLTGSSYGAMTGNNTLTSTGQINFAGNTNYGLLLTGSTTTTTTTPAVLTTQAGSIIHGYGIGIASNGSPNTINNGGRIAADVSGKSLNVATESLNNTGTVEATNGATLNLLSPNAINNSGTLAARTGSTINTNTNISQSAGSLVGDGTLTVGTNGLGTITATGGTISGNGTISATSLLNNGATLSAGNPTGNTTGKLSLIGNYTQTTLGKMLVELGGTTQGTLYDLFAVNGGVVLNGELDVKVVSGFNLQVGQSFDFLTYGAGATHRTGGFDNLVSLDGADQYALSFNDTTGIGTLTVTSVSVSAAPEAGSLILMLAGGGLLGGAAAIRYRSRARRIG